MSAENDSLMLSSAPLWHPVGLAQHLPEPGDYLSVNIDWEPVVVVRNREGSLRALSRVCRHRGFDMLEGEGPDGGNLCGTSGNVKRISCPYHAWTYDLDGQLIGAPVSDGIPGFDKKAVSLPRFNVAEVDGVVFVCLDSPAPDLVTQLRQRRVDTEALVEEFQIDRVSEGSL